MNATVPTVLPTSFEDGSLIYLSPAEIDEQPGFNPRQYYDPAKLDELAESIRQQGVQQNLVIRPVPDAPGKYWIVAGHRRWRAAKIAGVDEIPCLFRDVDVRQALLIAAAENDKRDNIGAAEEAQQARRMVDGCDGDRDEAARLLGWSRSRLDSRLLLLHAAQPVLDALTRREIKLGIAELLATIPVELQEKYLPAIIEKGYSVTDVRQRLESIAQSLKSAIFDTTDCAGCPHNSATQRSLFEAVLSEDRCTSRTCYAEKTRIALDARLEDLTEQYNAVFLDIDKAPDTWTLLVKYGKDGVGKAQFNACKSCSHYGALVSTEPGDEGAVKEDVCFNLICRDKKVAVYQKACANESPPDKSTSRTQRQTSKTSTRGNKKTGKSAVAGTPRKVEDNIHAFIREQAAQVAKRDPGTVRAVALHALLSAANLLGELGKTRPSRAEAIHILHEMSDMELEALELKAVTVQLTRTSGEFGSDATDYVKSAAQVLVTTQTDLIGRFVLDADFLSAHTKSGIEALLREATNPDGTTFAAWHEGKYGDGAFKKLLKKKHADLVKTVMDSGFDFSNWLPTCISRTVDTLTGKTRKGG